MQLSRETGLSELLTILCLLCHRSNEALEWGDTGHKRRPMNVRAPTREVVNQLAAEVVAVFSRIGGQSC